MSRFLVFDGVDGSGKSTQAARLAERLCRLDPLPLLVREPGSTALGEALRELLLHRELGLSAGSEALLFAAARRQLLEQKVQPALARGQSVVCDRFHASTFAYQGFGRGLDPAALLALLAAWAGTPAPDLELVLWLEPRLAAARRGRPSDRIEALGLGFQERVAEGYRAYVERNPRAVLIDARGSPEEVEARVLRCLAERLGGEFSALAGGPPWS